VNRLSTGKIPISVLNNTVLRLTGARSSRIVTPPKAGLDFAAVRLNGNSLLISADPITGVEKDIGEYAIKVSANDIATSGNPPQFAESVVLLPEGSSPATVEDLAGQMDKTAKSLGVAIVGGHTEVTPGLRRPIVVITEFSVVKDYVTSEGALLGDSILMTKSAGLEGTAILAGKNGDEGTRRRFLSMLSIVEEGVSAYKTGCVHAMHDCTEGGILGAAFEMSLASGVGFRIIERAVPIRQETAEVCHEYSIDPLRLIGSGALLLSVERGRETEVAEALRGVSEVSNIGEFSKQGRELVRENGKRIRLTNAPEDELWQVLSRTD